MSEIEKRLSVIENELAYIKKITEEILMSMNTNKGSDKVKTQLKQFQMMFDSIPNIDPEVKKNIKNIFDMAASGGAK